MVAHVASSTAGYTARRRRRRVHARLLCRQHSASLLAVAMIILDDVDAASDIVATTIAEACRPVRYPRTWRRPTRAELARSVYRRCIGRLATIERFGPAPSASSPRGGRHDGGLPATHRAVVALTVFGGHDLRQAAQTLRLPAPQVVCCLEETILARPVRTRMST